MKNIKAKALTEGAVCAALTVLFTVIAMYVPFFAMLSMFITGIPSMYLAVKPVSYTHLDVYKRQ